jgi:hypothetical protein
MRDKARMQFFTLILFNLVWSGLTRLCQSYKNGLVILIPIYREKNLN